MRIFPIRVFSTTEDGVESFWLLHYLDFIKGALSLCRQAKKELEGIGELYTVTIVFLPTKNF